MREGVGLLLELLDFPDELRETRRVGEELAESGFNLNAVTVAEPDLAKQASIYRTLVG